LIEPNGLEGEPASPGSTFPRCGRSKAPLHVLPLVCLVAALGISPAASQEADGREGSRLLIFFTEGLGYAAETGAPGAIVVRESLSAAKGWLSGSADFSSAKGVVSGNYSALVDSAGSHCAYDLTSLGLDGISLDAHLRYRVLFEDAWELRYGGTVVGRWGPGKGTKGFFGDMTLGFEEIRTAIKNLPIVLLEGNPLIRFDAGWRFPTRFAADLAIESFSDEDATYFPKTMFDFGSSLELAAFSLRCDCVAKYTDFMTPTGYLDGIALRAAATIPLLSRE